jgi:chaperonin GroES
VKFHCLYERVLVSVLEGKKESGEFVLPDTARDDFKIGKVISVGAGYINDKGEIRPLLVKEGMLVIFGPYAGTKVKVEGQEYLTMREGEIAGYLEE